MTAQRTLPDKSLHGVVTFDLLSDGKLVDPGYQVIAISITKEVNKIPMAKIVLREGEAASETFERSNGEEFIPGKAIKIKIGRDSENDLAFSGIIIKHCVKVRENGNADLILECKDESVRMTIGRHSRYFEAVKDSEVMEELISAYAGLTPDIETTSLQHKELVQFHVTDWDFVLSRADINGKLVIVDDGKVQVKSPDTSQEPTLSVLYGATLIAFEAEMDARYQWKKVKARAWDYANQRLFEAETEATDFEENGNIAGSDLSEAMKLKELELQHSGQVIESELQSWADACMLKSRLAKIRGRAQIIIGNSSLKPGQVIDIQGVGNRFNGKVFVTAIRHEIGNGEWDTHIQFGLEPKWFSKTPDITDVPASGLMPAINGLQIGTVEQLENDPDGEDRIQVKLPIIDPAATGVWARIATLDAGTSNASQGRGSFFRPEIGDEVIVGFINDDPRDAIILGMLNSSAKPAPVTAQNANHEKGIYTREGMRLFFKEDTKTITIDTPSGNSIIIDETGQPTINVEIKDKDNNSITMGSMGINIEAAQNITLKAGVNLELSAGAVLSIGAPQIAASADGAIGLSGASARIAASGIAEVSGSLVRIN